MNPTTPNITTTTVSIGQPPTAGFRPFAAVNTKTDCAYVLNSIYATENGRVAVIDSESKVTFAGVGKNPTRIVVNATTGDAYVMNSSDNTITVIHNDGHTSTIPTWTNPFSQMAINEQTNRLYIANSGHPAVTVVDLHNLAISTIPVPNAQLASITINAQSNRIYVGDQGNLQLIAIDGDTHAMRSLAFPSGYAGLDSLVVDPSADSIYTPQNGYGPISVVDGSNLSVRTVIEGMTSVTAYSAAANKVYGLRANPPQPPVPRPPTNVAIDVATGTVKELPPSPPEVFAFNESRNRLYLAGTYGYQGQFVDILDATTLSPIASVPVGPQPVALMANPVSNKVYSVNSNTVTIFSDSSGLSGE